MTTTETNVGHELLHLDPELLAPSPDNPRQNATVDDDFVASIHAVGIIEPLVVAPDADSGWVIIAGHRRHEGALRAELDTVPCYVRTDLVNPALRAEAMLIENLQRTNLNPIEEALGFQALADLGHAQARIAERVGCNQSHVSKRIKLLNLIDEARAGVVDGAIDVNDALKLATLPAHRQTDLVGAPTWQIDRAVGDFRREVAADRITAGGKELVDAYAQYMWDEVDEDEATHGYASYDGVTWLRAKQITEDDDEEITTAASTVTTATGTTGTSSTTVADGVAAARERSSAAAAERARRADVMRQHIDRIETVADRQTFIDRVATIAMESLTDDDAWDFVVSAPRITDDNRSWWADLTDDPGLYVAAAAAIDCASIATESGDTIDRLFAAWLDELDADPDEAPAEAPAEETVEEEPPAPFDDDERAHMAPWSTYDIVGDDRCVRTVSQLDDPDRLHHVLVYEQANQARPDVIEAATIRLQERQEVTS
jgi:ParB/RepB/Spo0J family partition protein